MKFTSVPFSNESTVTKASPKSILTITELSDAFCVLFIAYSGADKVPVGLVSVLNDPV